jgi:hypothetical protein
VGVALATGSAIGLSDDHGLATTSVVGDSQNGVYPGLRTVRDLTLPGGQPADSGVGVYPALSSTEELEFPGPAALEAARRYARTRRGDVAFAVTDDRGGIRGLELRRTFSSASLVKAMLLVAALDQLAKEGRPLLRAERSRLELMIRVSDNDAASTTYDRLGAGPVRELARRAGMRDFSIGAAWGDARVTAADQARFFISLDRLVSPVHRAFARELLQGIAAYQSWGIPSAARPRWRVFFKGGWRPAGGGELVHQAALLESRGHRIALAVLSGRNPGQAYGEDTLRGVAQRLLAAGSPSAPAVPQPVTRAAAPGKLAPLGALSVYRPPRPRRLRAFSG